MIFLNEADKFIIGVVLFFILSLFSCWYLWHDNYKKDIKEKNDVRDVPEK